MKSNGYRSLGAPVCSRQTLSSPCFLTKHHKRIFSGSVLSCLSSSTRELSCLSRRANVAQTAIASVKGYPEYERLLPCPSNNGPPRVEHLVVSEGGPVLDYICQALELPPPFVADLIHFGAVRYALVCPQPPPTASSKGKIVREARKTFRVTHVEQFVEAGTYLRVHVHPKRFPSGPPRIEHLVVSEGGPVVDYICKALDLPPLFVADLIRFGAVYYALVSPQPPPSATPEQIRLYKEATAPSVLSKRASIEGKTIQEAQKTFRITHVEQLVEAGTYLRVHVHPKRFPRCYEIDWKSRIVAVTDSYVVLDKPAGTSVGGTRDNIEESCVTFTTRALGFFSTPLKTTHQIDNCTEGCVVLARTKEFCSAFHGKIREKQVKKLYLALTAAPVPIGIITHYMRPTNIAPRLVSEDFTKGWYLCQLEVIDCKEVAWPDSVVQENYCIDDFEWTLKDRAYECKINLLTGRTHQVRAQLAARRAPIVGDSMYMPAAVAEMENPELNPFGKHNKYTSEGDKEMAVTNWIARFGNEPSFAIGLQACRISWDDGEHFYEARSPWWRSGIGRNQNTNTRYLF